ncbi:hypothetical protein KIN20_035929 [Parelaphostrongylus tenuis]|uniref:Uncharacterized protein n=1 Tax=Parelaphostrongylus tenuis TaxID=148309 RepID=A0AAD5RFC4_PARTN|nr:hypothetical protein KIN20_035929 [Parelaphostrongylus tenuis]
MFLNCPLVLVIHRVLQHRRVLDSVTDAGVARTPPRSSPYEIDLLGLHLLAPTDAERLRSNRLRLLRLL